MDTDRRTRLRYWLSREGRNTTRAIALAHLREGDTIFVGGVQVGCDAIRSGHPFTIYDTVHLNPYAHPQFGDAEMALVVAEAIARHSQARLGRAPGLWCHGVYRTWELVPAVRDHPPLEGE